MLWRFESHRLAAYALPLRRVADWTHADDLRQARTRAVPESRWKVLWRHGAVVVGHPRNGAVRSHRAPPDPSDANHRRITAAAVGPYNVGYLGSSERLDLHMLVINAKSTSRDPHPFRERVLDLHPAANGQSLDSRLPRERATRTRGPTPGAHDSGSPRLCRTLVLESGCVVLVPGTAWEGPFPRNECGIRPFRCRGSRNDLPGPLVQLALRGLRQRPEGAAAPGTAPERLQTLPEHPLPRGPVRLPGRVGPLGRSAAQPRIPGAVAAQWPGGVVGQWAASEGSTSSVIGFTGSCRLAAVFSYCVQLRQSLRSRDRRRRHGGGRRTGIGPVHMARSAGHRRVVDTLSDTRCPSPASSCPRPPSRRPLQHRSPSLRLPQSGLGQRRRRGDRPETL